MTPERARELAEQAWSGLESGTKDGEWNAPIIAAILVAVEEERARCIDICEKDLTQTAQKIANVIRGNALEDAK